MTLSATARLLPYHVRLAARSLRRNPVMTVLMFLSLALGGGTWSVAVTQYTRFHGIGQHLPPTLHHVELVRPPDETAAILEQGSRDPQLAPTLLLSRSLVSLAEARRLAADEGGSRHAIGMRAEVVLQGERSASTLRVARFTNVDFFALFGRRFRAGGPWTAAEDVAPDARVVVLGRAMADDLFPRGDGVGKMVRIDGRPHRVVGVLAWHQPLNAPWQLLMNGGQQDALFLPLGALERSGALPYQPIPRAAPASGRDAILASALFMSHWVDLPDPGQRAAYARYLERTFGPGGAILRDLSAWRRSFAMPVSPISFFNFIGAVVLLGGAFSLGRWLMTKGVLRGPELGVFRALGAPRASLFWRVLAEAALVSWPAALAAPLVAKPLIWYFNRNVHVVDIPLEFNAPALLLTVGMPLIFNLVGALYPAGRLAYTAPTLYLGSAT